MNQTKAQIDYLQRTLNVSFGMLASLLDVTSTRLDLWSNERDLQDPRSDRIGDLYGIVDIAVRYDVPANCLLNMLQTPISDKEGSVSLLYLTNMVDKNEDSYFPGFEDDFSGYTDFLDRFKKTLDGE